MGDIARARTDASCLWTYHYVTHTDSTNDDAIAEAQQGAPEGHVVVADYQRAGRGRLDRTWEAPEGTSVLASFLLRPTTPRSTWSWIPLLSGVAVVDAVRHISGLKAMLKWPNDVLVEGQKLAGILVQQTNTPTGPAAVVGIGLNVTHNRDQLVPRATSLAMHGCEPTRDDVVQSVAANLSSEYYTWMRNGGTDPELAREYVERCETIGGDVTAELPGGKSITGYASGLDSSGALVIETDNGPVAVNSGDINRLREDIVSGKARGH